MLCFMRMQKAIRILPLIILVMLSLFSMSGRVRFGLGLGDIIYHGLIYLGLLIYGIFLFVTKETAKKRYLIFPIIVIGYCGYLILMMTIWRGVEYRWDGFNLRVKGSLHSEGKTAYLLILKGEDIASVYPASI